MSADYIAELADAIRHLYHTEPVYVETVPVKEVFQGQTVWEGEVEVLIYRNHRKRIASMLGRTRQTM